MALHSKIEWCHHTANLWHGCVKVNAGCDHCYAETLSKRWNRDIWGADRPRLKINSAWGDLDKQQKLAASLNEMQRVFVGSMMDIFEKDMPMIDSKGNTVEFGTDYFRTLLFEAIEDGRYPNLIFLFLTKRPGNINKYIPEIWKTKPPKNVMFGTSVSNQEIANKAVPRLLGVRGKRFLSIEPMLGPVDLYQEYTCYEPDYDAPAQWTLISGIDWVICGGESGHHKRPMNLVWARKLRDDCFEASVPFFMKQIDKVQPIPDDLMIREFPAYHDIKHFYDED